MDHYTISNFHSSMPMRCMMQRLSFDRKRMHDYFEMSLIVSGRGMLTIEDEMYHFQAGDIFTVNPHTLHELRSNDCILVTVHFDQTTFEQTLPSPVHPAFFCVSSIQERKSPQKAEAFRRMRSLLSHLVKNNVDKLPGYELRSWAIIYNLMDILYNHFRLTNSPSRETRSYKYSLRIAEITRIVQNRYTENITLSDLSEEIHLSVPYLSKFFTEHFGMNFVSYVTQYRLNHAVYELVSTDKNIDVIALESGFPSSHAFVTAFKKEFNMLPNAYRKKEKTKEEKDSFIEEQHSYIAGLTKYLQDDLPYEAITPIQEETLSIRLHNSAAHKYPLHHTWKNLATVGSAGDILLPNVQQMLRRLREDTGVRYLRFNGIFSDRLFVAAADASGNPVYNFAYVDMVLDFLHSIALKPWIQLSFMPRVLALHPNKYLFNDNVSQPRSNQAWCDLLRVFFQHIRTRYGIEETKTWRYSLWNLPNTASFLYGFDNPEDFQFFYKASFDTIKKADPAYSISMPPSYYIADPHYKNSYIEFLQWCRENDCVPDSLSFAYYDTKMLRTNANTKETFGFPYTMGLSEDPDSFKNFVMQVSLEKRDLGLKNMPIYLTEWNNTPSQQDLLNDTCFKSCYIVKNILDNYDRLSSYGFWSLTDLMSDAPVPELPFFGGGGLFTRKGIPKASYFAFFLLAKLGSALVERGDGYYMTEENGTYQILMYNYQHFSTLYANGEKFDMTRTDRYTVFANKEPKILHVRIENLPQGAWRIRETYINRDAGSVFDAWVRSGSPDILTEDEELYLRNAAAPGYCERITAATEDGVLCFDEKLELLEIRLAVVEPMTRDNR